MKKITVKIDISDCDLQDFEAVAFASDDSEDFCWTFPAEEENTEVTVWFTKLKDEDD